jgi:hypothetical protein
MKTRIIGLSDDLHLLVEQINSALWGCVERDVTVRCRWHRRKLAYRVPRPFHYLPNRSWLTARTEGFQAANIAS